MTNSTPSNQPLPTPSIEALYSQEFPDTMSFDAISAKLDSMRSHPAIAQLRQKFCYQLAFVLTDGFTQCEQISLEMEEDSLLKSFYENIKELDAVSTDSFFSRHFIFICKKSTISAKAIFISFVMCNGSRIF